MPFDGTGVSEQTRAFVAISLPEDVRANLTELMDTLGSTEARVSWTPETNLHLTLRFLGDVDGEALERNPRTTRRAT